MSSLPQGTYLSGLILVYYDVNNIQSMMIQPVPYGGPRPPLQKGCNFYEF